MTQAQASYVEKDCKFEHDGRTFESGGAVVTDSSWSIQDQMVRFATGMATL